MTSRMYEGAEIVNVEFVRDPGGTNESWFVLGIETKCPFHLSQNLTVPNDPSIFDQIDIPMWDGSNVADRLREAVTKANQ